MKLSAQTQFPNVNMISEAWWQEGAGSHTVQSSRQARQEAAVAPPGHRTSTLGWPANKVNQDSNTSAVISARQTAQRTADTRQGQPDFRTEGGSRSAPSNGMARAAFAFTGASQRGRGNVAAPNTQACKARPGKSRKRSTLNHGAVQRAALRNINTPDPSPKPR